MGGGPSPSHTPHPLPLSPPPPPSPPPHLPRRLRKGLAVHRQVAQGQRVRGEVPAERPAPVLDGKARPVGGVGGGEGGIVPGVQAAGQLPPGALLGGDPTGAWRGGMDGRGVCGSLLFQRCVCVCVTGASKRASERRVSYSSSLLFHSQVGRPGVEDDVERLGGRAQRDLAVVLCEEEGRIDVEGQGAGRMERGEGHCGDQCIVPSSFSPRLTCASMKSTSGMSSPPVRRAGPTWPPAVCP